MPLELERELLNGSPATKDTRHAAQATRCGGRRGAATSEECLYSWKQVFVLERSSTGTHLRFNANNPSSALGHAQASANLSPLQCLCCSGWMTMVGSRVRRLQPDLHLTRARELLPCLRRKGCSHANHPYMTEVGCPLAWGRGRLPGEISGAGSTEWQ